MYTACPTRGLIRGETLADWRRSSAGFLIGENGRGNTERRSSMAATSESYLNHLRGQLKEWERAFRGKNGHGPRQADFEALERDSSARGRLVHRAYQALNRATGDSFIKVCGWAVHAC